MSTPADPEPAKLVIGVFTKDKVFYPEILEKLVDKFGNPDCISEWFSFDYTDYYTPEMGGPLFRRMASFKKLIDQGDLAGIKLFSNSIEHEFSQSGKRSVNIDPGYLLKSRFVLATGKDFTHRIYIGDGIYADLTLLYQNGGFRTLPWTYPDYADTDMARYLTQVRRKYVYDLNEID